MIIREIISSGRHKLRSEFGSTRIKVVPIAPGGRVITTASYNWENQLIDGIFTYHSEEVWIGIRKCYKDIAQYVKKEYGLEITNIYSMGFSATMHGYLVLDKDGSCWYPFETWRNTITGEAADILSKTI